MQSKRMSLLETVINSGTGYAVALAMNYYLIPLVYPTVRPSAKGTVALTLMFTLVSVVRTYVIRRLFVWLERKMAYEHYRVS